MAHALENGRLIHVDAARQGGNYECPDCGGRMCPVQGARVVWHWRHLVEGGWCGYSGHGSETVAHLAAKEALEHDRWLRVPPGRVKAGKSTYSVPGVPGGIVRFEKVLVEQKRGSIKPDLVGVLADGRELFIEVCVSNRVGPEKRAEIERLGIPCVEITMGVSLDHHDAKIEWVWHPAIAAEHERRTTAYDTWLRERREADRLAQVRRAAQAAELWRAEEELWAEEERAEAARLEASRVEERDRGLIAEAVRGLSDDKLSAVSPSTWRAQLPAEVSPAARWGYVEAVIAAERKRREREAIQAAEVAAREADRLAGVERKRVRDEAAAVRRAAEEAVARQIAEAAEAERAARPERLARAAARQREMWADWLSRGEAASAAERKAREDAASKVAPPAVETEGLLF